MIENAKLKNGNARTSEPAKKPKVTNRLDESRVNSKPKAAPKAGRTILEDTAKPTFDVDSIAASIE
jgi:hypothetical protein